MRRLQRTIEEIGWTQDVPRLVSTDPVIRAFDVMARESHDCVLVMHGDVQRDAPDTLAGIFTSRDFLNRVAATRRDPASLTLGDVMTRSPRTLKARDCIAYAINWMAVEGFRNVPIVDDEGCVLGVLTVWDMMQHLGEIFEEIDATPRMVSLVSDISAVSMVDIGGDQ